MQNDDNRSPLEDFLSFDNDIENNPPIEGGDPTPPEEDEDNPGLPPDSEDDGADDGDDDNPTPPDDGASGEDSELNGYYEFLKEYGVLATPEDFEFDGTPEKFKEALDATKQAAMMNAYEDLWGRLPEDFKPLLEYALSGGRSIDEFMESRVPIPFEELNLEDTDTQRLILYRYYKETSNYPDDKINRFINLLEKDGDLHTEAQDAYSTLLEIKQQRQTELLERQKKEAQQYEQAMAERTQALVNAIDQSAFIHPSRRNKVRTFFFNPVKTQQGETTAFNATISSILSNPEHQAQLADLLLDYDPEKGFTTDRFEKRVKSKATQSFQQLMHDKINPKTKVKGNSAKPQTDFDWDNFLNY